MIIFCCATPYHVMSCLNLAINQYADQKKILILYPHFSEYKRVVDIFSEYHIFEQIIVVSRSNISFIANWQRRSRMVRLPDNVTTVLKRNDITDFFIYTLVPLEISLMIKIISKNSPRCHFSLMEDGIGSYLKPDIHIPKGRTLKWMKFLERIKYLNKMSRLYLINPSLQVFKSSFKIEKMIDFKTDNREFWDVLKNIFGRVKLPDTDILILQQPLFEDYQSLPALGNRQEYLYHLIEEKVSSENILMKPHPRSKIFKLPSNIKKVGGKLPFELVHDEKLNTMTIITINSTAAFTPYLIWQLKPRLILLYKLFPELQVSEAMDRFVTLFYREYREHGGTIFIPNTVEEYEYYLQKLFSECQN